LLEKGDEYFTEYPQYEQTSGFVKSLGIKVKPWYLDESKEWKPDIEDLKNNVTKKTKIIFLDNPNNPSGALLTYQELKEICEVAEDVGAYVHCDNALRGSELDGKPGVTPYPMYEKGITTGSISKLGATSPRIGWIIADKEMIDKFWVLKDYTTLSHSGIGEYIAERLLAQREKFIKRNLEFSRTNLDILSKWVKDNQGIISWTPPRSGFTAFPKYDLDINSTEFCKQLLREQKVMLSPGDYFGMDKHLRINIGSQRETFQEALIKVKKYLVKF
jgi:aspartate/methionine/tyrosine aminotransferase